jgi:phage gp45-like
MTAEEALRLRLQSLFGRGVVRHADVKSGLAQMQAEFYAGEVRRVELPTGYGFTSAPLPGAEVFAAFAHGERSAGVALAFDDRTKRPKDLKPGEVVLYGLRALEGPDRHFVKFTDEPRPGTIKVRASRLEFRAGDHYVLLDKVFGRQQGTWDAASELPLNPGGSAL